MSHGGSSAVAHNHSLFNTAPLACTTGVGTDGRTSASAVMTSETGTGLSSETGDEESPPETSEARAPPTRSRPGPTRPPTTPPTSSDASGAHATSRPPAIQTSSARPSACRRPWSTSPRARFHAAAMTSRVRTTTRTRPAKTLPGPWQAPLESCAVVGGSARSATRGPARAASGSSRRQRSAFDARDRPHDPKTRTEV